MERDPIDGLNDGELADLARFADGTLPADRRANLEARVAASPSLAAAVEQQRIAVDAIRATTEVGAPARLRAHIDRRRDPGRVRVGARRVPLVFGGAAALVGALVLAVLLVLPGATSTAPAVLDAAALGTQPPSQPAPHVARRTPAVLRASVGGVPFPDYSAAFGWKPNGARQDAPSGRDATTVFYGRGDHTIAYTIVSGAALQPPSSARRIRRGDSHYRLLRDRGRSVVTWERGGHTCVLSSARARPAELVTLAAWRN